MPPCPTCAELIEDETAACPTCSPHAMRPGAPWSSSTGLSRSNYATIAVILGSIGWVFMRAIPGAADQTLAVASTAINEDALPAATLLEYGAWIAAACYAVAVSQVVVALFAGPPP